MAFSIVLFFMGSISNNPVLVQIMARRQTGDKPLSELMMALPVDTYITQPEWVNASPSIRIT